MRRQNFSFRKKWGHIKKEKKILATLYVSIFLVTIRNHIQSEGKCKIFGHFITGTEKIFEWGIFSPDNCLTGDFRSLWNDFPTNSCFISHTESKGKSLQMDTGTKKWGNYWQHLKKKLCTCGIGSVELTQKYFWLPTDLPRWTFFLFVNMLTMLLLWQVKGAGEFLGCSYTCRFPYYWEI